MKQIFALVVAFTITTTAFSQAGQKWSTTGNATTSGDFIGSTNNEPLMFKTNDVVRGKFTASGKFQVKNLEGIGFRLLQTDSSGKLSSFPMSNDNEVLYGDGIWRPLPTPPPSTWELNGTSLFYLNGKVGIGTKTPFTNFDVIGDAYISNNLYVGGGIIITEKINANKEVLTAALRADSIVMDSTKAVYGYSVFKDQVRLENKLQVVGNTQIDGNFRVNGDFIFGNNKRIGYLPASGGNPEIIGFGRLPQPPTLNSCLFPAVPLNQFEGLIQSYGNNGAFINVMTMGFDGANGIIEMEGTSTGVEPRLLINYQCGKDIFMNTGVNGGNVIMTSPSLGNVGIGTSTPTAKLDVVGGVTGSGDFISNGFMQSALGYKFPDGSIQSTAAFSLGSQSSPFQEIYVNNYIKIGTNSLWLNSGTGGNNEIYTTNGALVINPVGVSVGGGSASTGENTYINPTLGNVGIGTTVPEVKLHIKAVVAAAGDRPNYISFGTPNNVNVRGQIGLVQNTSEGDHYMLLQTVEEGVAWRNIILARDGGNVGIGTNNPITKLDIHGKISVNNNVILLRSGYDENHGLSYGNSPSINLNIDGPFLYGWGGGALGINHNGVYTKVLNWNEYGQVGIGTEDTKGYRFAVNGNMIAEEIVVKHYANWPDFVFDEAYQLTKLSNLEEFITTNKHLPNVPSEKDVKENGISLGKMDAILLQKIEELTLYILEQNKRIAELEKRY